MGLAARSTLFREMTALSPARPLLIRQTNSRARSRNGVAFERARCLGEPAATRAPLYRGAFGQNRAEKHLFDTAKQRTTALVQRAHRMMDETVDRKILSEGF